MTAHIDKDGPHDLCMICTRYGIGLALHWTPPGRGSCMLHNEGTFPAEEQWEVRKHGFQSNYDLVKVTSYPQTSVSSFGT